MSLRLNTFPLAVVTILTALFIVIKINKCSLKLQTTLIVKLSENINMFSLFSSCGQPVGQKLEGFVNATFAKATNNPTTKLQKFGIC